MCLCFDALRHFILPCPTRGVSECVSVCVCVDVCVSEERQEKGKPTTKEGDTMMDDDATCDRLTEKK